MKVTIFLEHRFQKTPDGTIWGKNSFNKDFWQPYLKVFENVEIVARIKHVDNPDEGFSVSSGDNLNFKEIPYYLGPLNLAKKIIPIQNKVASVIDKAEIVILRVPTTGLSHLAFRSLRKNHKRYAIEVVADPYDVLSPGTIQTKFRKIYQWWLTKSLKRIAANATYASYVTEYSLQRRYPPVEATLTSYYSDVIIGMDTLMHVKRTQESFTKSSYNLVCVGTMSSVLYKAQDILIEALARVIKSGVDAKLTLVGDGERKEELIALAERLEIANHLNFVGYVKSGKDVYKILDQSDLFILPSRQEGLPRAMIEAMARGLPCIGSNVGGIPELISKDCLVKPNDIAGLSAMIASLLKNPVRMAALSKENSENVKKYTTDTVSKRRIEFYQNIAANER